MIWEVALLTITPGQERAFEAAAAEAVPLFKRAKGCRGMQIQRAIERPNVYRLVVDWETLEDHTVHFRGSQDFLEWRRLVGPFFAEAPAVEHTQRLALGFQAAFD